MNEKEPPAPKRPLTPYMKFSRDVWASVKSQNPDMSFVEISRTIGKLWHEIPKEDMDMRKEEYEAEKLKYLEEQMKYREEIKKIKAHNDYINLQKSKEVEFSMSTLSPANAYSVPTHAFAAPTHAFGAPTHAFAVPTHRFAGSTHSFGGPHVISAPHEIFAPANAFLAPANAFIAPAHPYLPLRLSEEEEANIKQQEYIRQHQHEYMDPLELVDTEIPDFQPSTITLVDINSLIDPTKNKYKNPLSDPLESVNEKTASKFISVVNNQPMIVESKDYDSLRDTNIIDIDEVKEDYKQLDIHVCGACHHVEHFVQEFVTHKEACTKTPNLHFEKVDGEKSKILAFLLWKNSQFRNNELRNSAESWQLYNQWTLMSNKKKRAWLAAGTALFNNLRAFGCTKLEESDKSLSKKLSEDPLQVRTSSESKLEDAKPTPCSPHNNKKTDSKKSAPSVTCERPDWRSYPTRLTLNDKLEILEHLEKRTQSVKNLIQIYQCGRSTIYTIFKNKDNIREKAKKAGFNQNESIEIEDDTDKTEGEFEDEFEDLDEDDVLDKFDDVMDEFEDDVRGIVEGKVKAKVEEKAKGKVEEKDKAKVEGKAKGKVEEKAESNVEDEVIDEVMDEKQEVEDENDKVEDEVKDKVEAKHKGKVEEKVKGKVEEKAKGKVMDEKQKVEDEKDKVEDEKDKVEDEKEKVEDEKDKVEDEVKGKVEAKPKGKVEEKVKGKVVEKAKGKVSTSTVQLKGKVMDEKQKVEDEKDKVEDEVKDKVEAKPKSKVEEKVKRKVEQRAKGKVEEKVKGELEDEVKDKADKKAKGKGEEKVKAKVEEKVKGKTEDRDKDKDEDENKEKDEDEDESESKDDVEEDDSSRVDKESPELEENEFVVEDIISCRLNDEKGCFEYLVKWEGYPPEENTWEPIENLSDCHHLIERFKNSSGQHASVQEPDDDGNPRKRIKLF